MHHRAAPQPQAPLSRGRTTAHRPEGRTRQGARPGPGVRPPDVLAARAPPRPPATGPHHVACHGRRSDGGRWDSSRRPRRGLLGRAARRGTRRGAERDHPCSARGVAAAAHARPRLPTRPARGRRHPAARGRAQRRGVHGRQLGLGAAGCARRRRSQRRPYGPPRLRRDAARSALARGSRGARASSPPPTSPASSSWRSTGLPCRFCAGRCATAALPTWPAGCPTTRIA